jgi:hypothetical protein
MSALNGRKLLGAHRKGKQMWLTLEGDKSNILMHLGGSCAQQVPLVAWGGALGDCKMCCRTLCGTPGAHYAMPYLKMTGLHA